MSPFGAHVSGSNQDIARQLVLDVQIPLVINTRMQAKILAGDAGQCLGWIQRRETGRQGYGRAIRCFGWVQAIALEARLEKERQIVVESAADRQCGFR